MANNLEKKLASVLVNSEKNAVLKELNILKPDDPIERAKVNANIIDDDRIKTLLEFRKNIPQENLALYKKELERETPRCLTLTS